MPSSDYTAMADPPPRQADTRLMAAAPPAPYGRQAILSDPLPSLSSTSTPRLSSPFLSWLYQVVALWQKSLWVLRQSPLLALTFLIFPALFVLILYAVSYLVRGLSYPSSVSHDPFYTTVAQCVTLDVYGQQSSASVPCTSLTYAPQNAITQDIIQRTLAGTALGLGDVRGYPTGSALQLAWTRSVGSQDLAVIFNTQSMTGAPLTPFQWSYTLWYNSSAPNADWRVMSVQFALEQAIANTIITDVVAQYPPTPNTIITDVVAQYPPTPSTSPRLLNRSLANASTSPPLRAVPPSSLSPSSLSFSYLPQLLPQNTGVQVVQYNDLASTYIGSGLIATAVTILTLLVVHAITTEKQAKLLAMMRMNGLHDSAYWISSLLFYAVIAAAAALLTTLIGLACGLQVYVYGSFMVHWVTLWLFTVAMMAFGLFIASLVSRPRWVNLMCFLFLALMVGYSFGLSTANYALYSVPIGPPFAVFLSYMLPVYHWDKVWLDMSLHSQWQLSWNSSVVDNSTVSSLVLTQQSMTWGNLYDRSTSPDTGKNCAFGDGPCCDSPRGRCTSAPAPGNNLGYLILLTIIYTAAAWYCSQIGDSHAGGKKAWFLCTPSYWRGRGSRPPTEQVVDGDTQMRERMQSRADQSIRTVKLTKEFKGGTTAVKELTLTMNPNECFCLLGHNGAGQCPPHPL